VIAAADLERCSGIGELVSLLGRLGYPAEPHLLDPEAWTEVVPELPWNGSARLYHLCRIAAVDLFALEEGEIESGRMNAMLRGFRARNPIRRQVFFHLHGGGMRLIDLSPRKRLRRLEIVRGRIRAQDVERINLIELRDPTADVGSLFDRALDRETITREFFQRFRKARAAIAQSLTAECAGETQEEIAAESLLILSRILFLYFVQEKGWLNEERRFLIDRLDGVSRQRKEYFREVLVPLFFGCLNTPRAARTASSLALGRIPYLNGGLFEPSSFERRWPSMSIENDLMRDVLENVFERFSFSIAESEEEPSIDPEMLGKVFESLMQEEERLASGSFYTPREIVDVLTERAVRSACGLEPSVEKDPSKSRATLERLRTLRILDPACGSGAFLLSALTAIESLTLRLAAVAGCPPEPMLRQRIVERSLFGVDIKPEAVRLCELRLWLAIASVWRGSVDEVPPLPNLDRNILQGNSLLSPLDFLGDGRAEIYRDWALSLRARADDLQRYRTAPPDQKPALYRGLRESDQGIAAALLTRAIEADQKELAIIRSQVSLLKGPEKITDGERFLLERMERTNAEREKVIRGRMEFFSYDVHFAQVMADGGFDVVVGNPPWIRSSRVDPALRRMIAERYQFFRGSGPGFRQGDLAVAFFERGLALVRRGGVLALLVPSKFLNARYARDLRRSLAHEHRVLAVDDWSERRLFEGDTFPAAITILREREQNAAVEARSGEQSFLLGQSSLVAGGEGEWSLLPPEVSALIGRLRDRFPPLAATLGRAPLMGVKTGDNGRFFIPEVIVRGPSIEIAGVAVPADALCRCIRGRDVRRWRAEGSTWMLWPPRHGWNGQDPWVRELSSALDVDVSSLRLAYVRPEHLGTKVIWKDVSRGLQAVVADDSVDINGIGFPVVPNQTTYFLDVADLEEGYVIAAVLNSSTVNALGVSIAERAKDAHFRYFAVTVGGIPLPEISRGGKEWRELAKLSRRGHAGFDVQEEVDRTVAALYGLSISEAAILDRFLRRKLERS
jgi:adenine-specific DNA-methyltransferase